MRRLGLWRVSWRTSVAHTITYFGIGALAYFLFDYRIHFSQAPLNTFMRPADHPLVMAGVLFQPLRGLLFGIVFYLLQESLFFRPRGWLVAWVMLVVVGIVSTFGPAPGSIEGFIYSTLPGALPVTFLLVGLAEVLVQSLLFSVLTLYWVRRSPARKLDVALTAAFVIVLLLPILGLIAGPLAR